MKIFLLQDIKGVGRKHETKDVNDGYAKNMLIPKGLAKPVTKNNQNEIKAILLREEKDKESNEKEAKELFEKLNGSKVLVQAKATEEGHLFAAVNEEKISSLSGAPKESIVIKTPIKSIGVHEVGLSLAGEEGRLVVEVEAKA